MYIIILKFKNALMKMGFSMNYSILERYYIALFPSIINCYQYKNLRI